MIDHLRSSAANEHSRKLADKLAREWGVDDYWPHPAPPQDLAELEAWRRGLESAWDNSVADTLSPHCRRVYGRGYT